MKITTKIILAAYQTSKEVYDRRMNKNDAIEYLENTYGINKGSASGCIVNFKKMMNGEKYTLTNNAEQTDYFLTKILTDYGVNKLSNAIKAVNKHIEYQKGLGKNLKRIRLIISRHEKALGFQVKTDYPGEIEKHS